MNALRPKQQRQRSASSARNVSDLSRNSEKAGERFKNEVLRNDSDKATNKQNFVLTGNQTLNFWLAAGTNEGTDMHKRPAGQPKLH